MKAFHETIIRCYKGHMKRELNRKRKLELNFPISSAVFQAPWVQWNAEILTGRPEAVTASVQRPLRKLKTCMWEVHFQCY